VTNAAARLAVTVPRRRRRQRRGGARRGLAELWSRPNFRLGAVLFATALVLRVTFVTAVSQSSIFALDDQFFYHTAAAQITLGHGFATAGEIPTAQEPPGYAFALAGVYELFGVDRDAGELFNALLGAITVPLLFFLVLRVVGPRAAVFAGGALAVMPGQIYFADALLSETLYTFVLVGFFVLTLTLRPRGRFFLLLGVAAGLGALTRGEGLILLAVPLAMWWEAVNFRTLARRMAWLIVGVALVIVPWTIRNVSEMHAFVPVSLNLGPTMWSGHNPRANGGAVYPGVEQYAQFSNLRGVRREVKYLTYLRGQAVDYMVSHPLRELELIPLKFLSLNRGDSRVIPVWLAKTRRIGGVFPPAVGTQAAIRLGVLADFAYYSLVAAFLASLLVFRKRLWADRVMRAALVYISLAVILYSFILYGNFRYRMPLETLMLLVAAPLASRLWQLRRAESRAG
jgi:4-amino-4-deoxy-L-arabinose transferase-like glycosyltransferase